jgi:hypothetical protein
MTPLFKVLVVVTSNNLEHPSISTQLLEYPNPQDALQACDIISRANPLDGSYTQSALPLFNSH